jgi:zinc protease
MTTADLDRSKQPEPGAIRDYQVPAVHSATLPNGLRSLVCRAGDIPLVTAHAVIDAGASTEQPEYGGISNLTANALESGTGRYPGHALAWALEELGLELTAWTTWDAIHVRITATAKRIEAALGLFAEIIRNPVFPESEVERLRDEQLGDIMQRRTDPRVLADDMTTRFVYAEGSTYKRPIVGMASTVRAFTAADTRTFHASRFVPANVAILLTGDIDAARGHELVKSAFGDWTGTAGPVAPTRNTQADSRTVIHMIDRPGSVQTELRMAHVGVAHSHPDHFTLAVMNAVLGGTFTSRLNLNLREKNGFTYGVRSAFTMRRDAGPFAIQTAVGTDVTVRALEEAFKETRAFVAGGVTEEEVANARDYLAGVFPLQMQSTEEIASRLAEIAVYGLPDDYFQDYRERILAVTAADVNRAAPAHIRPDEMTVIVVGDATALRAGIEALGLGEIRNEEVPGDG